MTSFKFVPGQVFYIYDCFYHDHDKKYYGCLVTRVTPKRVFFTIQGEDFEIKSYAVRGIDENNNEYGNCHSYLLWFDKDSLQHNPDEVPQDVVETTETTVITEDNDEPCTESQDVIEVTETSAESQDTFTESIETNNPVIICSETPIDDETYTGILKAFDLDIYCGESVKQGDREYFAPVPRFNIEPDMYLVVSADIGEAYDTIFSVKNQTPHQTPLTSSAPNNLIKVDFAARRKV
jgi:hypothetical protein